MFSQVSVILSGVWVGMPGVLCRGSGYAWVPCRGRVGIAGGVPSRELPEGTHPVLTSSGGHRSWRYASYWNAFLFNLFIRQLFLRK